MCRLTLGVRPLNSRVPWTSNYIATVRPGPELQGLSPSCERRIHLSLVRASRTERGFPQASRFQDISRINDGWCELLENVIF